MRLFLLALALPLAASAQSPTAADSALVQRFSDAARLVDAAELSLSLVERMPETGPMMSHLFGDISPHSFADSTHAAFYREFRPEALREAVEVFESPAFEGILDFQVTIGTSLAAMTEELDAVIADPDAFDLADESVVREYIAATRQVETTTAMMENLMVRMMGVFPGAAEEAAAEGMTIDAMVREMIEDEFTPEFQSMMLLSTRFSLRNVPEADIRFATAFYASDAGRYVNETMVAGTEAAMEPLYDRLAAFLTQMFESVGPPPEPEAACKKGTPGCEPAPPPPPPCPEGAASCPEWEPLHDRD